MFWKGQRESGNVEDRRFGGKSVGIGGLLIGAFVVYLMGGNPIDYITQNTASISSNSTPASTQPDDEKKKFAAVVLGFTEDAWTAKFSQASLRYRAPRLVLYRGRVDSACGASSSATGPFYCPTDEKIYLDLTFFDDLSQRLGAQGDTAAAYVIAHEVGHHVQRLLGMPNVSTNEESVKVELQADCLAGVWAKEIETKKKVIEPGDIEEAIGAAAAVGDDRLQQKSRGLVVPDSFTHGSSAQRVGAFRAGYSGGELASCNVEAKGARPRNGEY